MLGLMSPGNAQDHYYASYFTDLYYGETLNLGDLQIVFAELKTDSRCPKAVTCFRAGEAKVEVDIYIRGEFLETRKLIFPAEGTISEKNNLIFSTDEIRIMSVALHPYPNYPDQLRDQDYFINIKVN